jgi:hypothetical protein
LIHKPGGRDTGELDAMNALTLKSADIQKIAGEVRGDRKALSELVGNLISKNETLRHNSARVLNAVCREHPEALSPFWDDFVRLLESDHLYWKLSVVPIIAGLTRIDKAGRFEKIFGVFYGLLDDRSFISAVFVAQNSGTIVLAKPGLRTRILNRLLAIDRTRHVPERKDLVKGSAIEAFDTFFDESSGAERNKMIRFAEDQLESKSPKTKKTARDFLKKRRPGRAA